MKYEATVQGLAIANLGHGYRVQHATSSNAATPPLRQRRFAEEARAELLATGVDFTASPREIQDRRAEWADVYYRWQKRAQQESFDDATGEYYSPNSHYGVFIPSAAWAASYREALTLIPSDGGEALRQVLNNTKTR